MQHQLQVFHTQLLLQKILQQTREEQKLDISKIEYVGSANGALTITVKTVADGLKADNDAFTFTLGGHTFTVTATKARVNNTAGTYTVEITV